MVDERRELRDLPALVLLVDDEAELRSIVRAALERDGYRVLESGDVGSAQAALVSAAPDLVVLDIGLPGRSGLDLLREMRTTTRTPVIVLTGRGEETDRVVGLELGADDYVVKPFSPRELAARVRAVLRRGHVELTRREFGPLSLNLETRDVMVDGHPVSLTAKEYDLLLFLTSSPRQVFSVEQLLRHVWGAEPEWQSGGTVSEHVYRLRRKLGPAPDGGSWIGTIRSVGYRFDPPKGDPVVVGGPEADPGAGTATGLVPADSERG